MAYPDDLIAHANFLVDLNGPQDPKQVDLRRAVSAAYYALFHLLTTEAAQNWKHIRHQNKFARIFDHRPMKTCSAGVTSRQPSSDPAILAVFEKLRTIAKNFVDLQQALDADYDNARIWSRTEAYAEIAKAEAAVAAWAAIRGEEMAQDYLYDLLDARR
ncbi:MAG TPA: hypothetical protein VLY24_07855 [Bryobacteraceae bacterium]|nr:hypothetical protein [Bryobacteraceae bacterium]